VDDVRVEVSELDPRVDRLFASAMEQQLEEQRTLTRLAGRVEAALEALQRGIAGLAEHLDAVAAPLPVEAERTRVTLLGAVARLERDAAASRGQVLESLERLRGQLDLPKLGSQIVDLADRVEQSTAPLPVALGEIRSALVDALDGVERVTVQSRGDLSEWLRAFWKEFEGRLSRGHEEAARAVAAAQRALTEQTSRIEMLRETLQAQAGHAADRVAALLDQATASQREALAAIAAAATQLTAEASSVREAAASQSDALRKAVAEAVAGVQAGLDSSLATAQTISEQVANSDASSRDAVERIQRFVEALGARVEQAQAAGSHRLNQAATALERATEGLEPSVTAVVDEFRQALFDTVTMDRAQSEASVAALRETTNRVVSELRALVDDACRRLHEAHTSGSTELSSAAASVVRAADDLQPAFSSALARLYGAVAAAATQVRATSEEAAAHTDAVLAEALRSIESAISDRLAQASATSQDAATRLTETQVTGVTRLEQAAKAVEERAAGLHPALVEAADELRRSLLDTVADDRSRIEASLGAVQRAAEESVEAVRQTVDVAVERLSAAAAGAVEWLAAAQRSDAGVLTDAADRVVQTAESLAPAVASAITKVDGTVNEAIALVEDALSRRIAQSDTTAQDAAAKLLTASDEARERLRVWLAGALPDAVAQVTVGLVDQLERTERRVDETANRLEVVCADAGSGLQVAAERASAQMTEAAQALTAVADTSVESRLVVLNHQVDALIERMDVAAEAEERRADAVEAVLAHLREAQAGRGPDLAPGKRGTGAAHDLEAAALRLQGAVERAENIERRAAEGVDRVIDRLDAALAGLSRLEASFVDYLRERDRIAAVDRERLLSDLVDQLSVAAPRKEGRLLGGLLTPGRRREEPPPDPPVTSPRSVRPESVPLESLRPEPSRGPGRSMPAERVQPGHEPVPPGDQAHARRPAAPFPACEICGFVGKSAAGLAAHRRTHQ